MRAAADDLVVLVQMADAYRRLALEAVHRLARVTKERDAARAATLALREELRRYTAQRVSPRRAA